MDSYCVLNESGGVDYGGVEEIVITAKELIIQFRQEAIEELELSTEIVTLQISMDVDMGSLRGGLNRVLSYGKPEKIPRVMNL